MLLIRVCTLCALFLTLLSPAFVLAHDDHHHHADIMVKKPVIKPTPPGITNSAAYFTLMNHSQKDLTLVDASSDVANQVEVHEHTMKDGLMRMQKVAAITLPAGESLAFFPGGFHIMFIGVKETITKGDKVIFYLHFDNGDKLEVEAVAKMSVEASHQHKHLHNHHPHKNHQNNARKQHKHH